jgi:hypothetical protein
MEILFAAVIAILTAQLAVLAGIFLRLGGMKEAIESLKDRVTKIEKEIFHHERPFKRT